MFYEHIRVYTSLRKSILASYIAINNRCYESNNTAPDIIFLIFHFVLKFNGQLDQAAYILYMFTTV